MLKAKCSVLIIFLGTVAHPLPFSYAQALPAIDPKAEQSLQQMANFLKQQQSFSFQADITLDEVHSSGQKIQYAAKADFVVLRPNHLRADYQGDRRQVNFFYDGKNFTMQEINKNLYGTIAAPSTIDTLIDQLEDRYDLNLPMGDLISTDTYEAVRGQLTSGSFIGLSSINDVSCNHLAFTAENIDWQIWIKAEGQPVPCKLIITYKNEAQSPQYTAILSNWDFSLRSPNDPGFSFTPPSDAVKIELLPNAATSESSETTGENQ